MSKVTPQNGDQRSKGNSTRPASLAAVSKRPDSKRHLLDRFTPRIFDIWALGIGTVINGQYGIWNYGLSAGFGSFVIGQVLVIMAYIILGFSIANIIFATMFAGGSYGIARVTVGFYGGFIIAGFELMEHVIFIASSIQFVAEYMCTRFEIDSNYFVLISFLYCSMIYMVILGGQLAYWSTNRWVPPLALLVLLLYCFGSFPFVDISTNGPLQGGSYTTPTSGSQEEVVGKGWFAGGAMQFFTVLPYAACGFTGIESSILVTDMVENPRYEIPYGLIATVLTLSATMLLVLCVSASLPPHYDSQQHSYLFLRDMSSFMDYGFTAMGIPMVVAEWLKFPAVLCQSGCFLLPSAKLYYAMSESNLLPAALRVHEVASCASPLSEGGAVAAKEREAMSPVKEEELESGQEHSSAVAATTATTAAASLPSPTTGAAFTGERVLIHAAHCYAMLYTLLLSWFFALLAHYFPDVFTLQQIPLMFGLVVYLSNLYSSYSLRSSLSSTHSSARPIASNAIMQDSSSSSSPPSPSHSHSHSNNVVPNKGSQSSSLLTFYNPFQHVLFLAFAACIFIVCFLSIIAFQPKALNNLGFLLIYFFLLTIYYFLYGKAQQRFSASEERRLLALHVVRNNQHKRQNRMTQQQRNRLNAHNKHTVRLPTTQVQHRRSSSSSSPSRVSSFLFGDMRSSSTSSCDLKSHAKNGECVSSNGADLSDG